MKEFFETMEPLQEGFWYVALITSIIFVVQLVFTVIGTDFTDGLDADFDGDLDHASGPFQLFSFRNLINFLMGFGWTGVAFYKDIPNSTTLIILASGIGIVFVVVFFFVINQIMKLTEDNTFKISSLVGKTGEVYLRIPEHKSGLGKVQISHKGTNHEVLAFTNQEAISSGSVVKILGIEENILLVEKH